MLLIKNLQAVSIVLVTPTNKFAIKSMSNHLQLHKPVIIKLKRRCPGKKNWFNFITTVKQLFINTRLLVRIMANLKSVSSVALVAFM